MITNPIEQNRYFYQNALWVDASPESMMGPPIEILVIDMLTATIEDLKKPLNGKVGHRT